MEKKYWIIFGILFSILILIIVLALMLPEDKSEPSIESQDKASSLAPREAIELSKIKDFFKQNPEYGIISSIEDMPDWAFGMRKKIKTDKASYLVYLKDNEVEGVDKYLPNGEREKIFQKDNPLKAN